MTYNFFSLECRKIFIYSKLWIFWWIPGDWFLPKNESKDKFLFSIEELVSGGSILHSTGNPLASVHIWVLVSEIRNKTFKCWKSSASPFVSVSWLCILSHCHYFLFFLQKAVLCSNPISSALITSFPLHSIPLLISGFSYAPLQKLFFTQVFCVNNCGQEHSEKTGDRMLLVSHHTMSCTKL